MQQKSKLRVALQRSGRLATGSQNLLERCGVKVQASKNQLLTQDCDFGIDFIFARDDDIPGLVETGICDIGIIGDNLLSEYCGFERSRSQKLITVMKLGFSKCRLSMALPKDKPFESLEDINDKIIATSYPNTLRNYLKENNLKAQIVTMHGSVELAPQIGISDLICDLVSSGATLSENGLKEVALVSQSEAVLIRNDQALSEEKQKVLNRLMMRIEGVLKANQNKYVMLHIDKENLSKISEILPGCESPTVVDLKDIPGKVAVHVVSVDEIFWETVERLKTIGASSILVLPIEKVFA